ncbi:MAG: tRNA lysidine(34) synthetase TilS [Chitinophagaceae bacterium]|nr:tRNA lysidine(34) synthetase TilS [Chitinophagaceae bacterium]
MKLELKFESYWQENIGAEKSSTILVAVSGGKDSMALAAILLKQGFKIAIAHCNFQLREGDALLDEELVLSWAVQNQVPCHNIRFDTKAEMAMRKMGVQECARLLRYNWFQALYAQHGYAFIATAHHANDNAETLLINLCKGTGIAGLHGILPISGNIIRPLLFATRTQIELYVHEQQIPYREDASNQSTKYLRNAIRHNIIPELEAIFPNAIAQINNTIARVGQSEIIYKNAVNKEINTLKEQRGKDIFIPILKLKKKVAYQQICFELFTQYGFTALQIPELLKLMERESGHYVAAKEYSVFKNRAFLIITKKEAIDTDHIIVADTNETIHTAEGIFQFSMVDGNEITTDKPEIALVDIDTITWPLLIRRKRLGDYFYPLGMGMKKKKLSKYLVDNKVPIHQKEKIWLIESDKKIVWIAAHRQDERYKVKSNTKKMLQIHFLPH